MGTPHSPSGYLNWDEVDRVLIVRLRSIGDAVLTTPAIIALKRFRPDVRIDLLLEDWLAPLLDGLDEIDEVIPIGATAARRLRLARRLRRAGYDAVFNLHGGPTSTFLTRATGSRHRFGYSHYQFQFLYTDLLTSASDFWQLAVNHSAEQQLALLGSSGVPVEDKPGSKLPLRDSARQALDQKLRAVGGISARTDLALMHPAAADFTKQWGVDGFAAVADYLERRGLVTVAVGSLDEEPLLEELRGLCRAPVITFGGLPLPEITALAARSSLFVGNDSGIAHIAAAVGTPEVVIFGSSNREHWRPWKNKRSRIVYREFPCQPCPGRECREFGDPRCIREVTQAQILEAVEELLHGTAGTKVPRMLADDRC